MLTNSIPSELLKAIETGQPAPTNAAQAAELERLNGAKHAAKLPKIEPVTLKVNVPKVAPEKLKRAREWAMEQLRGAIEQDAIECSKTPVHLGQWLEEISDALTHGFMPQNLTGETHTCPSCQIDCRIDEQADGPSDTARDVPHAQCPLCDREWYMVRGEWEAC